MYMVIYSTNGLLVFITRLPIMTTTKSDTLERILHNFIDDAEEATAAFSTGSFANVAHPLATE